MRRLLAIAVVLGGVALAVVLSGAGRPDNSGITYYIEFDNAFSLTEGGPLRIGGVEAGKTTRFSVTDDFPAKAVVETTIEMPGFEALRKDATCAIRQQSLVGEYYVDCQPGTLSQPKIPNAGTVPVEQTESTIAPDLVNNVMRRPYRERLRLIISELGAGLAGRPEDLGEVLQRAHPGFRETSKTLRLLGNQNKIIQDFIVDSDTVVAELEAKKTEVSRWIDETGETAEISASRKEEIEENFRALPPFLDELDSYMVRLGRFADAQIPTLVDLRRAGPELETTLRELGPFARASRPALRSLGEVGDTGRQAIAETREEIDQVRLVAADAPRLATPLRQFLQTVDDRNRAVEPDPEAERAAPPMPDKTAVERTDGAPTNRFGLRLSGEQDGKGTDTISSRRDGGGGVGFTGFEAFYAYLGIDQASALNGFDDVSHFLRVVPFLSEGEGGCTPYEADPNDEQKRQCTATLGDFRPGVTDPDPTEDSDAQRNAEDDEDVAGNPEDRSGDDEFSGGCRGSGPSGDSRCRELRQKRLRERRARARRARAARAPIPDLMPSAPAAPAPAPGPAAPTQLLDYLLAP